MGGKFGLGSNLKGAPEFENIWLTCRKWTRQTARLAFFIPQAHQLEMSCKCA